MEAADFWNDPESSQQKMKQLKSLKEDVETYGRLESQYEDIETLLEMGYEENDASLIPEIEEALTEFQQTFETIRVKTLPPAPAWSDTIASSPSYSPDSSVLTRIVSKVC